MNKLALYIIAFIVAAMLLLFTCTFQVRFSESAVVTTFGKAGQGAQKSEPGLHLKWPYPIQTIVHYDTRARTLDTQLENVVTKDGQLITVQVLLLWRIDDALSFHKQLEQIGMAESDLKSRLRSGLGVFSQYRFSELLSQDPNGSKLNEVERLMKENLLNPLDLSMSIGEYGIEPISVGVTRFILPEKTSESVFERMRAARQRLAADARSSGDAEAAKILADASANARKIEDFATRLSATITASGDREAAKILSLQAKDEDFAIFIQELEALLSIVQSGTTYIAPPSGVFRYLSAPPQVDQANRIIIPDEQAMHDTDSSSPKTARSDR